MEIFSPADILLPRSSFAEWAVIACDQHTSDPAYWQAAEALTKDSPSALRIILPEISLSSDNRARIEAVNRTMEDYLKAGIFDEYPNAYIYVERTLANGLCRHGLVGAVDLSAYDFRPDSRSLVRATEKTVPERIPPRTEIRRNAPLEVSHVLLLIDDAKREILEPLAGEKKDFRLLYDFDLMLGGGHIKGYLVNKESQKRLENAFRALAGRTAERTAEKSAEKSAESSAAPFAFAVGDGNHSLAAAKACYEADPNPLNRYALAEVVNLHDPALTFEPIYRVLFSVDPEALLEELRHVCSDKSDGPHVTAHSGGRYTELALPAGTPAVTTLQSFLDRYLARHPEAKIDYIHGKRETIALSSEKDTVGFLFEGMKKEELFPTVRREGALVRKTFSLGEAADKRYYIEARRIREKPNRKK